MGLHWSRITRRIATAALLAAPLLFGGCPQPQTPRPSPGETDPNENIVQPPPSLDDSDFIIPQERPVTVPEPIDEPVLLP